MKTFPRLRLFWFCSLCVSAAAVEFALPGDKDQAVALAHQADDLLAGKPPKDKDAAALLVQAAELDPDNMDIWLKLGWVYLDRLHDPKAAYRYLTVVVKRRPADVDARKLLELACSQTGRRRRAEAEFEEALSLQPDDLWIRANYARSLARLGEYRRASALYANILSQDPTNAQARLGEAELAAWQGHTAKALEILNQLLVENPTHVEALTLKGDVERWDWRLTPAEQDYQEVLGIAEKDYDATTGLAEAKRLAASDITLNGYEFEDTTHFYRESAGLGTRLALSDRAYLLGRADGWHFTSPGFNDVDRVDGAAGLEYHWARFLETSLEGEVFDYEHQQAFFGGQLSTKLSPVTDCDIYTTLSYNQPFISSMPTVVNGLKQESIGNGVDIKIGGGFSIQNGLTLARISDGNTWWEEKPQLSYRLFGTPLTFIRVEYDYLHYSNYNTNYWTPNNWQSLAPVIDTSIPLGKALHLNLKAQASYVFDASRFGVIAEGGLSVDLSSRVQFGGSFLYASIPGAPNIAVSRPPWAGHGGQVFLRLRF